MPPVIHPVQRISRVDLVRVKYSEKKKISFAEKQMVRAKNLEEALELREVSSRSPASPPPHS